MNLVVSWMLSRKILVARSGIFAAAVILTLPGSQFAASVFQFPLLGSIRVFHILWAFVMSEMILVLIPGLNHFTGCGKLYRKNYVPRKHDPSELAEYTSNYDLRAIAAALVSLTVIFTIGLLRLSYFWIVMLALFLYFLDQIFVNFWCPLQKVIIGNRCCATCRIHNWGYILIVSPLLYIPSFWSYSLIGMGVIILVQWEYLHYKYPERFSELSNATLSCKNCNDKCKRMEAVAANRQP